MKIREFDQKSWLDWDHFVRQSIQGTIFQTSQYFTVLEKVFHRTVRVITVIEEDRLVGGMVIYPGRKWGIPFATCPFYIPYNGILSLPPDENKPYLKQIKWEQNFLELIGDYLTHHYAFCEMVLHYSWSDLRSLVWKNWQFEPVYTIRIPLSADRDLWKEIPHNQRRHIRKFEKETFHFEETKQADRFYDLWSMSYRHHRMYPPLNQESFQGLIRELMNRKIARCFVISVRGEESAMMLVVEDGTTAYALFSGKNFHLPSPESELSLHWQLINYYQERGFEYLDLLGAMAPSISRVKLELGGRLQRGDSVRYFRNRAIRTMYQLQMQVMRYKRYI